MSIKKELRSKIKKLRLDLPDKSKKSTDISKSFLSSDFYNNSKLILFYAALDDEVNLDTAIQQALNDNKLVALPLCTDSNGNMDFYYIKSFDDLIVSHFDVREPDPLNCKKVTDFSNCVCVVPGLSFDKKGYRLGYGKGYYDRFLSSHTCVTVGICYNELICDELPYDEYDVPVQAILTQECLVYI